ncbi:Bardet-Biedl syndrome 2 protein [Perkinsus olseni]|uniref:Bardet-Biedl syndrome 2 protein n=1 Tax=Perkinsus olseni TaxID=32597 RepID=A0A7J6NYH4_PEROL|nr:Bardet-Biedl syndrome 2 protein [Perkinsus olseni]
MATEQLHFERAINFTVDGDHSIVRGLATVGRFTSDGEEDGKFATGLALGTAEGKVLIVTPTSAGERKVVQLNVNKKITALATWTRSEGESGADLLCIATSSSLSAYDVERNSDVFYRDMPDGVSALSIADALPGSSAVEGGGSVVLAGGDCNIKGFDRGGGEVFWTITGDRVMALESLKPSAEDQQQHQFATSVLICGTDDYQIRILAGEAEVIADITEADAVCHLVSLDHRNRFGYGLANGTVGVYEGAKRLWRVRSRHAPSCLLAFSPHTEENNRSRMELAIGWMNGLVEIREQSNGQVIFKSRVGPDPLAGVVAMDYIGCPLPVLMTIDIEVTSLWHVWLPTQETPEQESLQPSRREPMESNDTEQLGSEAPVDDLPVLDETTIKKDAAGPDAGVLAADLVVDSAKGVALRLAVPTGVIQKVVVTAEGLYGADGHVVSPQPPAKQLEVELPIPRDVETTLTVKCITGVTKASREHTVLEAQIKLPRFAMYRYVGSSLEEHGGTAPTGSASFRITERIEKVQLWIRESFLMADWPKTVFEGSGESLKVAFVSCRRARSADEEALGLEIAMKTDGSVIIATDCMQLAADVIQHLCCFLKVTELEASCRATAEVEQAMQLIDEYDNLRQKMATDMADSARTVKELLVRMEDLRLCDYSRKLRQALVNVQRVSRGMIADYSKRRGNHRMLLEALRELNLWINRGANLRVGTAQAAVVAGCKRALKDRDAATLVGVISRGGQLGFG